MSSEKKKIHKPAHYNCDAGLLQKAARMGNLGVHVEWEEKICSKCNQKQEVHQRKQSDLQEGEFVKLQ